MVETTTGSSEGSWFAYVTPRPAAVTSWLLPRKDSKKVERLMRQVSASWDDETPVLDSYSSGGDRRSVSPLPPPPPISLSAGAAPLASPLASPPPPPLLGLARQPSLGAAGPARSYVFAASGLTVKQALYEVAGDICRVAPFVSVAPDSSAAVAFVGHLSNLRELARRFGSSSFGGGRGSYASDSAFTGLGDACCVGGGSPSAATAAALAGGSLARAGSIERSLDAGALTAATVLAMYAADAGSGAAGSECVLLSELQGDYAFVVLDNARRCALAARAPGGGAATLWYRLGPDGSAAFASGAGAIPNAGAAAAAGLSDEGEWRELPPGHYVSGKSPKLRQFALTPAELRAREHAEECGGAGADAADVDGDEDDAGGSEEAQPAAWPRRRSSDFAGGGAPFAIDM